MIDLECERRSEIAVTEVNDSRNFFSVHTELTVVHELFTVFRISVLKELFSLVEAVEMSNRSVCDITEEKNRKGELLKGEGDTESKDQKNERAEACAGMPVDVFETWIGDVTDHQKRNCEHQRWHQKREPLDLKAVENKYQRGDHSSGGRHRQSEEVFSATEAFPRRQHGMRQDVEASESNARTE